MKGVKRGCGTREQGCAYLEVPTSKHGKPIEHFLIDPPWPIESHALGFSAIGVKLFDDPTAKLPDGSPLQHVLDWIGFEHYPNVADFVEEVRRFGLSRKIARTKDFSRLGPGSRIYVAHARAIIDPIRRSYWDRGWRCPKHREDHEAGQQMDRETGRRTVFEYPTEMCAGLWWEDVDGVSSAPDTSPDRAGRVIRSMPSFSYDCRRRPPHLEPRYQLGMFASFPLAQVAVIRAADGSHEVTEHAARRSSLPVVLEDS